MSSVTYPHIELDPRGRPWIPEANTKVVEIVMAHLSTQWSALELQNQFPHLTLGQIHSALAYYHDHRSEMDEAIHQWHRESDEILNSLPISPLESKLKSLREEK